MGHADRTRGRIAAALALGALLAGSAGCDPCAGTPSCTTGPRFAVAGQIVEPATGAGVDGVRVTIVRRGGVSTDRDSVEAITRAGGHWSVDLPAEGAGEVLFDVRVASPNAEPYLVPGLREATVEGAGEARIIRRWVAYPYFPVQAELFFRGSGDERVKGVAVEFRRTGGVALAFDTVFRARTDGAGRMPLLDRQAPAAGFGVLVGDLTVKLPAPYATEVVRGIQLANTYLYRDATRVLRVGVGPNLDYAIQFFDRASGRPVPGVGITFTRTGGVATTPTTITSMSQAGGAAPIRLRALADGEVVGTVIVRPPAPGTVDTIRNVRLATFHSDRGRVLANWNVLPYMPYYGLVRGNGIGLAGTQVTVTRTSGITLDPPSYTWTVGSDGVLFLNPVPKAVGDAVVDLTFRPPAPYAAFTVHGLKLTAVEEDHPQGVLLWIWDLEKGPSGPPGTTITTP